MIVMSFSTAGASMAHLRSNTCQCRCVLRHDRGVCTRLRGSLNAYERRHRWRVAQPTCAAPKWNPQNTPDPKILPQVSFTVEEAVRVQMDAIMANDDPWPNHGIQTLYEFGEDMGGMERSRYFGFSKDLYHQDHFLGQLQTSYPELLKCTEYSIARVDQSTPDECDVLVDVVTRESPSTQFVFKLVRKAVGRQKGCFMTKSLLRTVAV